MSYTTPRTLFTMSGRSAEVSDKAGVMTSVDFNDCTITGWRMESRAVEYDSGESTAEHRSPLSFTSASWGNKKTEREKQKEEENKQINKCIQYSIEYKTVQDEVSAAYNCTLTTFSITTILSFLISF